MNFYENFSTLDLDLYGVRLPSFNIERKYKQRISIDENCSNYEFIKQLCEFGLKAKGLYTQEYINRLNYELDIVEELSFTDYLLLVWDVINFCKENNIPTGVGRGSAAGSLILYACGVTQIDPLKYGLFFERFISRFRAKKNVVNGITYLDGSLMCDVDLDICYYQRHKVLEYLEKKFENKTAKILTLNTLSSKLLIKECGKVIDEKPESEMTQVSGWIPKVFGQVKDIEEAYAEVSDFKNWCDENSRIYEIAKKLKDLIKNKGAHPSGVLLCYENILESCPTERSSDGSVVSSYDMNWVTLFNIKLDILGLRGVSVVDDVCKSIGINLSDIDVNDTFIYQNLQELKTPHGLFQIEADTNFKVLKKVKPKNLEELSGVLALARPGALQFVDKYASYTNTETYESIHSLFDDVLKITGGVALYQEQLMKMSTKIGFSLDEAEILRRIVGKKKVEEVKKWKQKIEDKIKEKNLPKEAGDILWKVLEDSANYSFNKSHSACYAALAAITVYLKFKYPQQFFLSLLKMTRHEPDPIAEISKIHKEMHHFGIQLLPPHLLKSQKDFSIQEGDIRFGLLSIKGISDKSIEKLNDFIGIFQNKFEIFNTANEAGLNLGILCALIQAGALEGFKQSRTKVVYEAQLWNTLTDKEKRYCINYGAGFDYDLVKTLRFVSEKNDEKNKPLIKPSRIETIRKKTENYAKIYDLNKKSEKFANWFYENKLLGYTYGMSLKDIIKDQLDINLSAIEDIVNLPENYEVKFIGRLVDDSETRTSKAGNKYMTMDIFDETNIINVKIFNTKLEECLDLNGKTPKKNDIVVIKGQKKDGCVFANVIAIQTNKIYTKLSEIKKDE
jgi:DNA polymerase-3 subunit alpha